MVIETKRLLLRPWRLSDAESLYEYAKDPQVGPIAGWAAHTSVEESQRIIQRVLMKELSFAVTIKGDDRAVGSISLMIGMDSNLDIPENEAELGFWIGVPFWGKGYIPEALKELIRIAFKQLGMKKIWCGYFEGNLKSKRVQEKCGFKLYHVEKDMHWALMDDIRTEYVTCLPRERWEQEQ